MHGLSLQYTNTSACNRQSICGQSLTRLDSTNNIIQFLLKQQWNYSGTYWLTDDDDDDCEDNDNYAV